MTNGVNSFEVWLWNSDHNCDLRDMESTRIIWNESRKQALEDASKLLSNTDLSKLESNPEWLMANVSLLTTYAKLIKELN